MEPISAIALAVNGIFDGVAEIIVSGPRRLAKAFDATREDAFNPIQPGSMSPSQGVFLAIILGTLVLVGVIVFSASRK